jgi:hypothetical protein
MAVLPLQTDLLDLTQFSPQSHQQVAAVAEDVQPFLTQG